jgi:Outer membrane efflux protein
MLGTSARAGRALLPFFLLGCAAPARAPIDRDALAESAFERGRSIEVVQRALELSRLEPLALEAPALSGPLDPDSASFWHACAYAYDPDTRAARQRLLAARARTGSSGAPGPIGVDVENQDFAGPQRETEVMITFDLLGLLGTGRAAAARELAEGEARAALAELGAAIWRARFRVDRARARAASIAIELERLEALRAEAAQDEPRLAILAERGWLPPADLAMGRASLAGIDRAIALLQVDRADARAELGAAAGLPPDAPVIAAVSARTLAQLPSAPPAQLPPARELLSRLPDLRSAELGYAIAEARLRVAAAETWPEIGLGPKIVFVPDDTLPGGILTLSVPFPGSQSGRVEAALHERELARQALEDQLLGAAREVARRHERLAELTTAWHDQSVALDAAAENVWRASRARFRADAGALERWSFALEKRIEPLQSVVTAELQVILAALDLEEACGPQAPPTGEAES